MAVPEHIDYAGPQREVQRLLGRCLLRLQQYERLLKSMIAVQALSGTPETLPRTMEARKAEVGGRTLGTLIGRLLSDYIMRKGAQFPDETPDLGSASAHFSFRMWIALPGEAYEALEADLRALVALRNVLVHHFIEHHDLWTLDGCLRAQDELGHAYAEIDRQFEQLSAFAGHMDKSRKRAVEVMQSAQFVDAVVNGIASDGQIDWPVAGIVVALRQALQELSIEGWANLDTTVRWVIEHHPEQTPRKYGCSRWRHVIHASGQFELRRFTHNGQAGTWFRERPSAAR